VSEMLLSMPVLRQMHGAGIPERAPDWRFTLKRWAGSYGAGLMEAAHNRQLDRFVERVLARRSEFSSMSDEKLGDWVRQQRGKLVPDALLSSETVGLVAAVAELSHRNLHLDPFPSQIRGVGVLLSGAVAEMPTGSGKTLTAAIAAIAAVYAGMPVHVITANDYLAQRDAHELAVLFQATAVSTGVIVHSVPHERRGDVYRADVVYASNKEIAFDYLRNRIAVGAEAGPVRLALESVHVSQPRVQRLTMRGLTFAIVDEADSVLIDECRTPLIISGEAEPDEETAQVALLLADALDERTHYEADDRERKVTLTDQGHAYLEELGEELGGVWRNRVRREAAAKQGVVARRYFILDEHYIIRDNKVRLVDEYSGRIAEDRSLGEGLHQVIEAKEGLPITGRRYTRGRITFQRFFRRYARLAGMTGTAREVAGELFAVYGLRVQVVKPHHPVRRRHLPVQICPDVATKWQRVTERVSELVGDGVPVLLATRTIKASEEASAMLSEAGIEHLVLNATQDEEEGEIIAQAGQLGRVTVATNMAGRGVDIRLGEGVAERGGLHVILTEYHEAGRIDRQVAGRCGRQGDPGCVEVLVSWEDPLVQVFGGHFSNRPIWGARAFSSAQSRAESIHARARVDLLKQDIQRDKQLSFTGSIE